MKLKLIKKPARRMFDEKSDYDHGLQVWSLAKLALEKGATPEEVNFALPFWGPCWLWETA